MASKHDANRTGHTARFQDSRVAALSMRVAATGFFRLLLVSHLRKHQANEFN